MVSHGPCAEEVQVRGFRRTLNDTIHVRLVYKLLLDTKRGKASYWWYGATVLLNGCRAEFTTEGMKKMKRILVLTALEYWGGGKSHTKMATGHVQKVKVSRSSYKQNIMVSGQENMVFKMEEVVYPKGFTFFFFWFVCVFSRILLIYS